jgi:hypothetical protein
MPDEKNRSKEDWSMPDPVYRTTEGRDLKAEKYASELPTETADRDLDVPIESAPPPPVRPRADQPIRRHGKKEKSVWDGHAAGMIVLGILVLGGVIYFLYFYLWKDF